MDGWMMDINERAPTTDGRTDRPTERPTDGPTDRWTDRQMDRPTRRAGNGLDMVRLCNT